MDCEGLEGVLDNCISWERDINKNNFKTVDQLVKVGSMVELDWAAKEHYWVRVNNHVSNEKAKKKRSNNNSKYNNTKL